jgi:uncharacterized protein YegP (UPF0339 family)
MPASRGKFVIRQKGGKYFWELQVRGVAVARATKGYTSKAHVKQSLASFQRYADAPVVDDA